MNYQKYISLYENHICEIEKIIARKEDLRLSLDVTLDANLPFCDLLGEEVVIYKNLLKELRTTVDLLRDMKEDSR